MDFSQINFRQQDAAPILNRLFAQGGRVEIPQGEYRIGSTLLIPSGTIVSAHPQAHFFLMPEHKLHAGEYLLTNIHHANGQDDHITIEGGIWDGMNTLEQNQKGDIFDLGGYSGTVLNFCGVDGLTLRNLVVANSETYNIRMARIDNFTIENISFVSDKLGKNQDGLHFNGYCSHGAVRNIRALSKGQTNDDLIALNADDSMERVENIGMLRGSITDIEFEDIYAQDCHTILRMLSVDHAIEHITLRNIQAGFRCYAINADAARYCRTPLFREEDYPHGIGQIKNVQIEHFRCRRTAGGNPAIAWETEAENVRIHDFDFLGMYELDCALQVRNVSNLNMTIDGTGHLMHEKKETFSCASFHDLRIGLSSKMTEFSVKSVQRCEAQTAKG